MTILVGNTLVTVGASSVDGTGGGGGGGVPGVCVPGGGGDGGGVPCVCVPGGGGGGGVSGGGGGGVEVPRVTVTV